MNAEEHIVSELKDGAKLSDIYNSTVAMVKKQRPELVKVMNVKSFTWHFDNLCLLTQKSLISQVEKLTKNFGFVMGIEFREGSLSITHTCHAVASKGMIFNVNIGLSGLVNKVSYFIWH